MPGLFFMDEGHPPVPVLSSPERGGSWKNAGTENCRTTNRDASAPSDRDSLTYFRLARSF